jgi:hypothetical protein
MRTTAVAVMIAGMVMSSGCILGGGPTIALRPNGDVRLGLDADYLAQVNQSSTPELAGFGGGFATTIGSVASPSSDRTTMYGYLAGRAPIWSSMGGNANLALGLTVPGRSQTSLNALGGYMAASAGLMTSVQCDGFAFSAELGIRWNGGLEFYIAARGNLALGLGADCGPVLNNR